MESSPLKQREDEASNVTLNNGKQNAEQLRAVRAHKRLGALAHLQRKSAFIGAHFDSHDVSDFQPRAYREAQIQHQDGLRANLQNSPAVAQIALTLHQKALRRGFFPLPRLLWIASRVVRRPRPRDKRRRGEPQHFCKVFVVKIVKSARSNYVHAGQHWACMHSLLC